MVTDPLNTMQEREPDSDIDPALIYDPHERQLHILRQKMKKASKPARIYASLKQKDPKDKRRESDMDPSLPLQKMTDVSDVLANVKSDLPNTQARLRR